MAPGHRRPLSFKLEPLPPAGSTSWETELRVSGFGWPAVQPTLRLPIKVGLGCVPPAVQVPGHAAQFANSCKDLCSSAQSWPALEHVLLYSYAPLQLPGGEEATMQCRPYNISPLQVGDGGRYRGDGGEVGRGRGCEGRLAVCFHRTYNISPLQVGGAGCWWAGRQGG